MNLIFFSSFSFELDILLAVASEIQVQNSFKLEKVLSLFTHLFRQQTLDIWIGYFHVISII